jgi:hypothetical protein
MLGGCDEFGIMLFDEMYKEQNKKFGGTAMKPKAFGSAPIPEAGIPAPC